ncbi:isochorismatase family protein [Chitinimonas lacunae]|uniref:Isochorismatase family protein n=1 Tax=Chitinimonas lacunae TaxID=1963018 RepID=A0ABV8MSN1_9NEIS
MSTVLLVVDMQHGAFDGVRCPTIAHAERLLARHAELIAAARAAAMPVVFVQHCDDESGSPFETDTPHGLIHPMLAPNPGEAMVRKRESDAFDNTELAATLTRLAADTLVICGLQSEYCVTATTEAALERQFRVLLVGDGHGTWPGEEQSADAISAEVNRKLAARGAQVRSSSELTASWREAAAQAV